MKMVPVLLSFLCVATLSACDASLWLPGASASAESAPALAGQVVALQREGHTVYVPEASPLRQRLRLMQVQPQAYAQPIEAPAVVEALPERLLKLTPPLTGRITRLHRQLGDPVSQGEALVTLDSPDLVSAYNDHAKAQAALAQASAEAQRQKALLDDDISARKDFESAQQALAVAQSDARATADRLAEVGAPIGAASRRELVLRAPISGRVVEVNAAPGGYWNDSNASILTLADLSTVWLTASVAEKDMPRVRVGQSARIVLNAYPGQTFEGRVRSVADLLDPETRTVRVRVALDNRQGLLKPGMFAQMSLAGTQRPVLRVPATALLQGGLATRVFVEQAPFRYESRIVDVGSSADGQVEVLSGLKAGERIVVQDGVLLND